MNKHLHRLVFSRRHGMRIAVAEHAPGSGKGIGERRSRQRRVAAAAFAAAASLAALPPRPAAAQARPPVVFASQLSAPAANLPRPYSDPTRTRPLPFAFDPKLGARSADLAAQGRVGWRVDGRTATFDQGSVERVVLNWDSFDIGVGHRVHFAQDKDPAKYVSALNRIWNADPTLILGALTADREVILLNANGVYFGRGARVDTGRFVASANAVADSVFERGLRNTIDGSAVFSTAGTDYRPTNLNAAVSIEQGAELRSAAGGDVLLVAPRVVNHGRIETPQGQAVVAAGDRVYLMSSTDPRQRGLIVAVDPVMVAATGAPDPTLGIAENAARGSYKTVDGATVPDSTPDTTTGLVTRLNEMRAASGTVNLVGLTVRQNGQVNATTAVKGANGAIYLQAMESTATLPVEDAAKRGLVIEAGSKVRVPHGLGSVQIGAGSTTSVLPDTAARTQLDAEVFNPSSIRVDAQAISVAGGARLTAPAGTIALRASLSAEGDPLFAPELGGIGKLDASRIVIAPGASLSTAGLQDVAVDGARNQGALRVFRIELADAPVQRSGALYRSPVEFDLRDAATITAANVTGAAAALQRTAAERSTAGGSISIDSNGAVVVGAGATLDVSGGSVRYSQTTLRNTLLTQDGRTTTFRTALAGSAVDRIAQTPQQTVVPAYAEGADGGSLLLNGRRVVLAGEVSGGVTVGERQRDGRSEAAAPSTLTVGRTDGVSSYYVDTIALRPAATPAVTPSVFIDPLQATLPGLSATTDLSLAKVMAGGFGSLALRADKVTQSVFGALDLGVGGAFDVRAGTSALNGAFVAPGGRISIVTPTADARLRNGDIRLSAATRLDVAGLWTNDTAAGAEAGDEAARIQVDGGTVAVNSARSVFAEPQLTIDVSAGARLAAGGSLTRGRAGAVTVTTGRRVDLDPQLVFAGVNLRAFDFDRGGTLTLGAPRLTIADGASVASAASDLRLAPAFFSSAGFGSITVDAYGDVRQLSGTRLVPHLLNWELTEGYRAAPSGAVTAAVVTPQPIDRELADRKPVSVALVATRPQQFGGGSVVIERGASIELEPGASLRVSATRDLEVGQSGGEAGQTSTLTARGGSISLSIAGFRGDASADRDPVGFVANQALWLGDGARLSVAGIAQLRREGALATPLPVQFAPATSTEPTPAGERRTGSVLGGGTITLDAARGYVIATAGSALTLDGAVAALNVPGLPGAVTVARAAGTLAVSSPEGVVLDGRVSAQAPRGAAGRAFADGGQLSVAIGAGGVERRTPGTPYSTTPRVVAVGAYDDVLRMRGVIRGTDLTPSLGNGIGFVRATVLQDSGFDALRLAAGNLVRFDADLSLDQPLGVRLEAPAIGARPGTQVALRAGTMRIGNPGVDVRGVAPDTTATRDPSSADDTQLSITAPTIEVVGTFGLQGFSSVSIDAGAAPSGEIRFSAQNPSFNFLETLSRQLNFAGALSLTAGQIYATSGTQYTLNGLPPAAGGGDAGSRLVVRAAAVGAPAKPPLSALASLTVNATEIDQGGTLRQPFGRIRLNAERTLTLGDDSITSTSGKGADVLFGQTANLAQWLLPGIAQGDGAFPFADDRGIRLDAANIVTSPTAVVDASGGGALRAWEFFRGVGGSTDTLLRPNLYAVLPDYAATPALAIDGGVLDPQQASRQFVVTLPGSGLAPGRYHVLPARYALLGATLPKGAFLVSRAADQGRTVLRAPLLQDDGSVVVTGYLTNAGSIDTGTPGERFVVEPQATFRAKSDLRVTDVSGLLLNRAAALGRSRPTLPRDGGRVQVGVSGDERSLWQARLDLAGNGGQAGVLDMAATRLALVDDLAKTPDGALGIGAGVIGASGAGSVLLGGRRSSTESNINSADAATAVPSERIDASGTRVVTVDLGQTALSTRELLLASSGSIALAEDTRIQAAGDAARGPRTLALAGDGALAGVSVNALDLQRSGAALTGGALSVGAGSVLGGAQVVLDATGSLQVDRSVGLPVQALSLGARRLVLGDGIAADAQATVLAGSLLDAVRSAPDLTLRGYGSVDFVGEQNWARRPSPTADQPDPLAAAVQQRLTLDAPLVRGLAAADGSPARADIAARDIVLRNTSGRAAATDVRGDGTLQLQALPPLRYGRTGGLTVGPGAITLGFASTALRSAGDIVLQGAGSVQAQQDLALSAARITAASGAAQSVGAGGTLRIGTEAGSRSLGERVGQGADVVLSATTVQQDGSVDLPGGRLTIRTSGANAADAAITFGPASSTSVAGFALNGPEGFTAFGTAGSLRADAGQGRIDVLGTLDVSAARRGDGSAGEGDAGSITLAATGAGGGLLLSSSVADGMSSGAGRLQGAAGGAAGDRGGRLRVDVTAMPSADALAHAAAAGGLTRELSLRVRSGDVALDTGITAERIGIAADAGTLAIGTVGSAPVTLAATTPAGGVVQLAAGGDLVLGTAVRIDARSQRAGANGGDVLLASSTGRVSLAAGATVDAGGDDAHDGRIVLRARRGSDDRSVAVDRLDPARLLAGDVAVEAVRVYEGISTLSASADDTAPGTLAQSTVRADNDAFMEGKPAVLEAMGAGDGNSRIALRAGVEIRSPGDLRLADTWFFNGTTEAPDRDRPGGDAGFLTLRAAGNLRLDGSLDDGFLTAGGGTLNGNARSWSFRLVAGADLAAAGPTTVVDLSAPDVDRGTLTLAGGHVARTGAGSIELAAGRDLVFNASGDGSAPGAVYVAGRRAAGAAGVLETLFAAPTGDKPRFSEQGGRLDLQAARDIAAPEATQLINNWFWRSADLSSTPGEDGLYASNRQLAWWTQFDRFGQIAGSFGGGNIGITAGQDIVNMQAMAPSAGYADGRNAATAALQVLNGGDVSIAAGRDVLGGQFFVGRGEGRVQAGGSVGELPTNASLPAPLLALMDGDWRVVARDKVSVAGAFNPTAVLASATDDRAGRSGYFYTWGPTAALRLSANTGVVDLRVGPTLTTAGTLGLDIGIDGLEATFNVLPPSLFVTAGTGNIELLNAAGGVLFPSPNARLSLWAGDDIRLSVPSQLAMADSDPARWPSARSPARREPTSIAASLVVDTSADALPLAGLHANNPEPVRIHAGDTLAIRGASGSGVALLLPKAATLTAGNDAVELSLRGQNLSPADVTRIRVGRNYLAGAFGSVELAGPGALELEAGRGIDLGASAGIRTSGNVRNANVPAQGASVRLAAATDGTLNVAALTANYLSPTAQGGSERFQQYRDLLLADVRLALKAPTLNFDAALAAFGTFPADAHAAFGRRVQAAEFGAVYLSGPAPSAVQVTAALQAGFDRRKADMLQAGDAALAAGGQLVLPGREALQGDALAGYLAGIRGLAFASLDLDSTIAARTASLARVQTGWRDTVAAGFGGTAAALDALAARSPQDPAVLAYRAALADFSGRRFEAYRAEVLQAEIASAAAAASSFGRLALPMRLALFDQGFQVAELAGAGSFVSQQVWPGPAPLFRYDASLDMTQSSVVTERGGDISLINPGGAINVGLKDTGAQTTAPKGVIALGGGDVFGYGKGDFQVNTQRVFIVGGGEMTIWSSIGDIDSGRGANTAVAAPPLAARRSVDGVVFEVPATTTGSGLGILEDAAGRRSGSIGLFPAFGEILALDAFIRAPSVVLGSTVQGADNLLSASIGGAAAAVAAPPLALPPPPATAETRAETTATGNQNADTRPRNSLLTVELLGLGAAPAEEECDERERRDGVCPRPAPRRP